MLSSDRKPVTLKADAVGIALFVLLVALLAWRITRGADFGDESYYAVFIDDWLKGSIATSTFRTIHQTAALLVYPAALAYARFTGSSDGLFLLLRVLFLAGAVISALTCVVFLKRLGHRLLAWAAGILVISFIPFGLPAPSYNTIGLQASDDCAGFVWMCCRCRSAEGAIRLAGNFCRRLGRRDRGVSIDDRAARLSRFACVILSGWWFSAASSLFDFNGGDDLRRLVPGHVVDDPEPAL